MKNIGGEGKPISYIYNDNMHLSSSEKYNDLLTEMKSGNIASIIFYLKTKGKKRGYVERQEITGKDGEAISVTGFKFVTDGD